ncbi:hypothetical protein OCA20_26620 [Bacillus cereus]|nr:hypothetical protein [Bacillus cereus]MCU5457143.1 hypothetical protein [Bacillus cereus]MCU5547052.1 hypothetical protein [Bacillus cereus]MCU5677594.1 hypothetical protein [Bacillus cereus]
MKTIFKPLTLIPKIKGLALIWLIFILIFGQAGILATLIIDPLNFFKDNLKSGNFYTFSIALLASSVLVFAIEWMNSEDVKFKTLKVVAIAISFLLISVMMIAFSHGTQSLSIFNIALQICLYILSLFLSIYFLCLEYIHLDYSNYKDLDDKSVNTLLNRTKENIESDDRGVKL